MPPLTMRRFGRREALALGVGLGLAPLMANAGEYSTGRPVAITAEDIAWLRGARVVWVPLESGAPGILPPAADTQDSQPADDAAQLLETLLCVAFLNAPFLPGRYRLEPPAHGPKTPDVLIKTIEVRSEHVALLQASLWDGPIMDGKRPYGDLSFYSAERRRLEAAAPTRCPRPTGSAIRQCIAKCWRWCKPTCSMRF